MGNYHFEGLWTGKFEGTNQGGLTVSLTQRGSQISGSAKVYEPGVGPYDFEVAGIARDIAILNLTPSAKSRAKGIGNVSLTCSSISETEISGEWHSDLPTSGKFSVTRDKILPKKNSVFIVHGRDEHSKIQLSTFLNSLGIDPVILQDQLSGGMLTVLEKFERYASRVGYAIVIMAPDDVGYLSTEEHSKKYRARQNVVFELGYFVGKITREKILVFINGDIEIPSDILGLAYEKFDDSEHWKIRLTQELIAAGIL